ncbi:MAG: discoidin domain-containing protein, partial [Bacteroidales bacterium]
VKNEREWLIDHNSMTSVSFEGSEGWLQVGVAGGDQVPAIDTITISGRLTINGQAAQGWEYIISGSVDGQSWKELGRSEGSGYPGEEFRRFFRRPGANRFRMFNESIGLEASSGNRYLRFDFKAPNAVNWNFGGLEFHYLGKRVEIAPSHTFTSTWMSAGNNEEWVYVDLGADCTFDLINLFWIHRARTGSVQVSDDAVEWEYIADLTAGEDLTDEIRLDQTVKGRYVRVLMLDPETPEGYLLSEMEVFGTGGPVVSPKASPGIKADGRIDLAGGAWRIRRESLVEEDGEDISETGFPDDDWIIATVPGTVLMSYRNAGALPDPNYGDNQLMISESFFYSDFWYRNEFDVPDSYEGQRVFINFDGINWKAEVFINGRKTGRIEGAFTRGKFDVTDILVPGRKNAVAVRIIKNATPGNVKEQTALNPDMNGGALGADNPTYHASIGWDWIPTIRGRNIGIWNDVYLTKSGPVTIENPFITTTLPLPDTSQAEVNMKVTLQNHEPEEVSGILFVKFGEVTFEQPLTIEASTAKDIKLGPASHAGLLIRNPKLWWPNGYGDQNLYDIELRFESEDNLVSDTKTFKTGIRQMTYSEENDILKIWINGRRFIGRGGNWGFPESNLSYRGREYDIAVRYHKDMNFTMIRNWVGQTGDDEFYEACDRHGIMIWQDFWLANPVDGPNPDDNDLFMKNAEDMVLRIRNHPSIALYCGRNEGNPPEELDREIRNMLPEIHPGIHYISHSAMGAVSGFGPYQAMPVKFYFENRATPKMHSEMGMPNVVTFESLQRMMPESDWWPIGRMWGIHDFCLEGNMRASSFLELVEQGFGRIDNVRQWLSLAQWVNYEGYRAMYEAQGRNRMGLVIWMSHPAWPSFLWQTYDYYFEPTAAYFGCKKASEPLHIQWNPVSDSIEVINYHAGDHTNLTAYAEILNLDGSFRWEQDLTVDSPEDSMIPCFDVIRPTGLTDVYFLRLTLMQDNKILSENFYWCGLEEGNYQAIHTLPEVNLESEMQSEKRGDRWYLSTRITNPSDHPALMIRLRVTGKESGEGILPVLYSDNYVSLMPGEERTIRMELEHADTGGEEPGVVITGFNIKEVTR